MTNGEHLAILKDAIDSGDIEKWNQWRKDNQDIFPNLTGANLERVNLTEANLRKVNLSQAELSYSNLTGVDLTDGLLVLANLTSVNLTEADLSWAKLHGAKLIEATLCKATLYEANLNNADLQDADLREADLYKAVLYGANLHNADLTGASLTGAKLSDADLSNSDLSNSDLSRADLSEASLLGVNMSEAILIGTDLTNALLSECSIYGISAWDVKLDGAIQKDLNISPFGESPLTVDNLKVAQFIYMLLNNTEIRNVLEAITIKGVLILGRFGDPVLKATLDGIRNKLRELNYAPIVFDFKRLTSRDYTETIKLLAGLCKFVIVDLSLARSIQQELQAIVPDFEIPVIPIIQKRDGDSPYSMFESHLRRDHVLKVVEYADQDDLIDKFSGIVIHRAERKYQEILIRKAQSTINTLSSDDIPLDESSS